MLQQHRVVISTPVTELWNEAGDLDVSRRRNLSREQVREIMDGGNPTFVVADVGFPLTFIPIEECYAFWKAEVAPHLIDDPEAKIYLEHFTDEYGYLASEWIGDNKTQIILLEKYH
jgi:hypothetical protein